ncbi:hypothetical protein SERLA73DRAFT_54579, partial [Serpula lacrymans var. lacrymans S7.3]
ILTYLADYPEKILIASIKNLGNCPCLSCLTPITLVPNIGQDTNMLNQVVKICIDSAEQRKKVAVRQQIQS